MTNKEKVTFKAKDFTLQVSLKRDGLEGVLDEENGPAIIFQSKDGSRLELFFRDGKLDRMDGPALDAKGKLSRAFMHFQDNLAMPPSGPKKEPSSRSRPPRP